MMEFFLSPTFWKTVLASTKPVMLATLAANMMTKSGIFNLAIEGTMLICALTGVIASEMCIRDRDKPKGPPSSGAFPPGRYPHHTGRPGS